MDYVFHLGKVRGSKTGFEKVRTFTIFSFVLLDTKYFVRTCRINVVQNIKGDLNKKKDMATVIKGQDPLKIFAL